MLLARKEVRASYHLSVVVDDAHQSVTDVVRGKDLAPSTSVHRVLQTLLGLAEPRYFHHRLILDENGEKLSKSRGSETIRARRAAGEAPATLIAGLGLLTERPLQHAEPHRDGYDARRRRDEQRVGGERLAGAEACCDEVGVDAGRAGACERQRRDADRRSPIARAAAKTSAGMSRSFKAERAIAGLT